MRSPTPPARRLGFAGRAVLLALTCALAGACARGQDPEARLEEIRALQDGGDFKSSLELLRSYLAQQPDDPEANYREGVALLRTGNPSQAIWPLQKVPLDSEFGIEAGGLLASTLATMQNFEEAVAAADRVLEAEPGDRSALDTRARAHLELKKPDLALPDIDKLLEAEPDVEPILALRAVALMQLERMEEARAAFEHLRDVAARAGSPMAGRACLAAAMLGQGKAKKEKNVDTALTKIRECTASYAVGSAEFEQISAFLDHQGRADDATALLRELVAKHPDDQALGQTLAKRLLAHDRRKEGLTTLEGLSKNASTPDQWMSIAELRRAAGQTEEALAAYREALALNPGLEQARFAAADLLIDLGRKEEAEKLAAECKEKAYSDLIRGRLAFERGDVKQSLELIDAALGQWPDNEAARLLAARAAMTLGRTDDAIRHLREAARLTKGSGEAAVFLARIYLARGQYADAAAITEGFLARRTRNASLVKVEDPAEPAVESEATPEAWVLFARALAHQHKYKKALSALSTLGQDQEQRGLAIAEAARVTEEEKGTQAAIAFLEKQDIDWAAPSNEVALRELGELSMKAGRGDAYRSLVERLAREHPSAPQLQVILATVATEPGDVAAAGRALDVALEESPDDPELAGARGTVFRIQGDYAHAIPLLEQSLKADPRNSAVAYELARAELAAGKRDEAEQSLRKLTLDHPDHGPAANDLAWLLAEEGKDLDMALDLAKRAANTLPMAEVKDTLGFVQLKHGQLDDAVATLDAAVKQDPAYGTARYHLALALAEKGDTGRARKELHSALGGAPFPEAEAAKIELARLEKEPSR